MNKKGTTIFEMVIALGITSFIIMIAIGTYVTVNRLNELNGVIKEATQKGRLAQEILSRYISQADVARVRNDYNPTNGYSRITLFFNVYNDDSGDASAVRFQIRRIAGTLSADPNFDLYISYCNVVNEVTVTCNSWGNPISLYGGTIHLIREDGNATNPNNSRFVFVPGERPKIEVILNGQVAKYQNLNDAKFFSNKFNLSTEMPLENFK